MKKFKKLMISGVIAASAFGTIGSVSVANANITEAATATKTITIEGTKVSVPVKGNKWVNLKGYWHFVKDGNLTKGWKNFTKADGENTAHFSYFDKNGRLYTGWHYMSSAEGEKNAHWSYFGGNGWLRTGWQQMGTKNNPDGNNKVHWSYFGSNGWLRTNWQSMGTKNNPDGNNKQHMSYFGGNGWLRTGWVHFGKGTSEPDGNSAQHWSYFGGNGWLRTGMQDMGTTSNPDGGNAKHQSYFGGNGWLVVNKNFTYQNKNYKADGRGWATVINTPSNNSSNQTHTHKFTTVTRKPNSGDYYKPEVIKLQHYIVFGAKYENGKLTFSPYVYDGDKTRRISIHSTMEEATKDFLKLYSEAIEKYYRTVWASAAYDNDYKYYRELYPNLTDAQIKEMVNKGIEEAIDSHLKEDINAAKNGIPHVPTNYKGYTGLIPSGVSAELPDTITYDLCYTCGIITNFR